MRNLRVFGISDFPITTIKLNAIAQCFLFFSLTISLSYSLKTEIAASITSSVAFSHLLTPYLLHGAESFLSS